ncbi:MAG: glutamate 5-kinase [Propionibacteriaceae bacterium]|nr:glutamate 5-kinase [Propionibacteriaceae bacterium]
MTTTTRTPDEESVRAHIATARRIVVKVGSSSLASAHAGLAIDRLTAIVDHLAARQASGSEVVLVSSGAIAAGLEPLGFTHRPTDIAQQQAAAAVGQGLLMSAYTQAFGRHDCRVAQVLLTTEDLARKNSYGNALRTFGALTRLGVIPVVNENDTVATQEIRLGDNDHLAALVAELVRADALVLLSDVDGLYSADPRDPDAELISYVPADHDLVVDVLTPGASGVGSGGMSTKVDAARLATTAGIPVILARWDQAEAVLSGQRVGTVFATTAKRLSRRHGWLAHASSSQGRLHIDQGAVEALTRTAASLLAAGVVSVEGQFHAGDSVEVVAPDGRIVARGEVGFDSYDLPRMVGHTSADLASALGTQYARPVIHRDDMVLQPYSHHKDHDGSAD